MGWKDLKLRTKLQSGFGLLAVVVLVVSVVAIAALSPSRRRFTGDSDKETSL